MLTKYLYQKLNAPQLFSSSQQLGALMKVVLGAKFESLMMP
jgi:hypothetical protein